MVDGDGIHGPHCTLGAKIAAAACRHSRPKGQQVKLPRVPLGAPFFVCKSCRQHARWHPSSRQMLHTKAPSFLCVGFSRQSVGGDTASTNVGGCGAVCECLVKTRDGDRGPDGEHRPGSPERGAHIGQGRLRADGGGSVPWTTFPEWLGPSQSRRRFWRSTTCAIQRRQPSPANHASQRDADLPLPQQAAADSVASALLPSERAVLSGALFRGAHYPSPPRAWDGLTKSHSFHTKQPIPAVPGPPRDPLRSPHHQKPATPTPSLRCVSTAAIYPAFASTRLRAGRLPLIVSVFPFASQSQCVSAGRIP